MQPRGTVIADVVDAIITVLADADYQVVDAVHIGTMDVAERYVVVGIVDGEDTPAYTTTLTGAGRRVDEAFSIRCYAESFSRDETTTAARRRDVAETLDDVLERLSAVAGPWDRIGLGSKLEWIVGQSPEGTVAGVIFDIKGSALR